MDRKYDHTHPNVQLLAFFFPILWCSHIGIPPKKELGSFGYMSNGKYKFLKILPYFGNLWNLLIKCGDFINFQGCNAIFIYHWMPKNKRKKHNYEVKLVLPLLQKQKHTHEFIMMNIGIYENMWCE